MLEIQRGEDTTTISNMVSVYQPKNVRKFLANLLIFKFYYLLFFTSFSRWNFMYCLNAHLPVIFTDNEAHKSLVRFMEQDFNTRQQI